MTAQPTSSRRLKWRGRLLPKGVVVQACTPHIYPGVYPNTGPDILARVAWFQSLLDYEQIPLRVVAGADVTSRQTWSSEFARGTF